MIGPATKKRDVGMLDGTPEKRLYWSIIEDSANLPDPDVLAQEIVDDLEAALEQFATIAEDLRK